MKKKLIRALTIALAGTMALGLAACGGDKTKVNDDIVNGGFEQGLKGWTKTSTAFSQAGVVETDEAGENKLPAGKAGDAFFSGYEAGNPQFTGTLTSDYFKLGGTGKIGFLMGGGMSADKCYVEFFEQGNDTALAKVSNDAFALGYITDQMVRVVVDLSEHIGKTVCIKITDNDKGDADEYAYLNLDDFVVYKTEEDVSKAQKERADKLAAIGKPAFSETETDTTIKNGDFEEGLENWLLLEGDAFGSRALCTDSEFWGEQHRSYNKQGDKFLNTYFDESATGSVRSTKFTLAGDGIISFLMAGPKNKGSYVAVCDGKTDEELAKVTFNEYFNDPNLCENMVRHYVKLDDKIGEVLYIKVVDGEKSEFAGIMVDDFKVSMVEADVKAQMKADYEWSLTLGSDPVALATQNYYSSYENYPYELTVLRFEKKVAPQAVYEGNVDLKEILGGAKAVYDSSVTEEDFTYSITGVEKDGEAVAVPNESALAVTEGVYTVRYKVECKGQVLEESFLIGVYNTHDVLNGGFELGAPAGWTTQTAGWGVNPDGSLKGVIGAAAWWGEELPYNQSGNYHLDGWNNDIAENASWTLKSSVFTLEGEGIVTVKMGGKAAAVKVYQENGTQIGYYKQTRFSDSGFPHIADGGSWADMATYILDLSEYVGQKLYIELCDEPVGDGWAHAFFDEVITYYAEGTEIDALAENSDTVKDGHTADETPQDVQIGWVKADNLYTPVEENENQVKNGGFETGDLTGWEFHCDTEGVTGNAVSANTTFWNEKIPYNKGGSFFFEGTNDFIPEKETWYLKSSNFTLAGSGFITFKMGGRTAEVRVFKADGTQIATFANDQFADVNFPNVGQGSRLGTMTTFVADLSAYIGEELYLELHDTGTENWGVACFDDIVTYYETAPKAAEHSDTVRESNEGDEVEIPWVDAKNTYVAA